MNKSKSIVKQASILAVAGILVRIIGLLYRSPLTALIGDEGIGYYSTAYNIYSMVLLISSYSIPTAISKLIAEKLAINQYKNARKIFKIAFMYICVISGVAALLTFILAPYIVTEHAVFALRILCPTIFLSGLVGVLRGYFQAYSTTLYTSVSQILEQVFNAIVSVLAAYLFIQPYLTTGGSVAAGIGAGGSALGTGVGVLIALCYMIFVYMRKHRSMVDEVDVDRHVDDNQTILKSILSIVTPIIVATCIYNLVSTIDMYIYYGIMGLNGMSSVEMVKLFGVYSGKFMVLMNVPVALASAMATASIPAISGAFALRDGAQTKVHIENGISVTMLVLIPSAVGMAVLAYPIMGTLFPQKETLSIATTILIIGSPGIVFFGLSTLTNGILQAIGEVKAPLRNAGRALIIHVIILLIALFVLPYHLYILAICNGLYGLHMCYLNQKVLKKKLHFKLHVRRTFLIPLIASVIMGIVVFVIYQLLFLITHMVFVPLMISIIIGIITYFAVIIYLYKDHPAMLNNIPYMDKILRKIKRS